jgi:hypothetical protein
VSSPKKIVDYYVLVRAPKHPRAVGDGYVYEHILVAERQLKRSLTPDEDVRHINGNTQDNRPSNLEIISTNIDYRARSVGYDSEPTNRKTSRTFMPCRYQKICWKTVRGPLAKKEGVYLPYICSNQELGDVHKCTLFWRFFEEEMAQEKEVK